MKIKKVHLYFEKEFPSIKCDECGIEFVLIGISRKDSDDLVFWEPQSSRTYCPYCGQREGAK